MKTLIELWDERPIENVLSLDVFKPEKVIYLCPTEIAQSKSAQKQLRTFVGERHPDMEIIFMETSQYHTKKVVAQMEKIIEDYPDCAIDITGGTDNMLFAAGRASAEKNISVFTYSHQKNRFYDISNASFAEGIECTNIYDISDYIKMTGGEVKEGRVNYDSLNAHLNLVEPLFKIFIENRAKWNRIVSFFQETSKNSDLHVKNATLRVKAGKGYFQCPADVLKELEKASLIKDLDIDGDRVSYAFPDKQIRFWLRDVGSALEAFTYKKAIDSKMFDDCRCSVIVEWQEDDRRDKVSNEIDVMGVSGVTPYFVSCKACKVNTYALNELSVLRDRFGGEGAVAMMVTSETCSSATKKRSAALNIELVDIEDLKKELN